MTGPVKGLGKVSERVFAHTEYRIEMGHFTPTPTRIGEKGAVHRQSRRALRTGNLTVIRAAAAELPAINLEAALSICLLLAKDEPHTFERAALRWIGRYCLERRGLTVEDVRDVAGAFARLRDGDEAETLRYICSR